MDKITLTQKTINAILDYKQYILDGNYAEYQETTSMDFKQGELSIFVEYGLDMEWIEGKEIHNEIPPPNIEDLSHYECVDVTINEVFAFDRNRNLIRFDTKVFK